MPGIRIKDIERTKKITVVVNGRKIAAYEGETVLALLTAADHLALRYDHRTGRPRGALCGMGVCHECLVTINGASGRQACMTEIEEDMEIELDAFQNL